MCGVTCAWYLFCGLRIRLVLAATLFKAFPAACFAYPTIVHIQKSTDWRIAAIRYDILFELQSIRRCKRYGYTLVLVVAWRRMIHPSILCINFLFLGRESERRLVFPFANSMDTKYICLDFFFLCHRCEGCAALLACCSCCPSLHSIGYGICRNIWSQQVRTRYSWSRPFLAAWSAYFWPFQYEVRREDTCRTLTFPPPPASKHCNLIRCRCDTHRKDLHWAWINKFS